MEPTKSIFQSKTFWFNLVGGLVGISTMVTGDQLTELGINGVAQKWTMVGIGAVVTFGNIYLRSITNAPVTTLLTKK